MRKGFDTNCTDCGRVFNAPNRATLYCNVCRLSRNLIHFGVTTTKCAVCGDRFCPTRAKQVVCPKHYDRLPGAARHHVDGALPVLQARPGDALLGRRAGVHPVSARPQATSEVAQGRARQGGTA
jgi:hypothetical protein